MNGIGIALVLTALLLDAPAPAIHATFPPPEDHRRPDLAIAGASGDIGLLAYTADGRLLAGAGAGQTVHLWHARPGDPTAGTLARTLEVLGTAPVVALGNQGQPAALVAVTADGRVSRWEPATGKLLAEHRVKLPDAIRSAAVRPGAQPQLALATPGRLIVVDYQSGKVRELKAISGGEAPLLAFSADGKLLASASGRAISWWDIEAAKPARGVTATLPVQSFVVVGDRVAAGHGDGSVSLWSLSVDGPPVRFESGVGAVVALAPGNKGAELAVAGTGDTEIWDVATAQKLCSLAGSSGTRSVVFNPNGQKLATSSGGGLHSWTVPLPPIAPDDLRKIEAAVPDQATARPKRKRRLLVFWRAEAILHKAGVPAGNKAIELLAEKTEAFEADFSRDYEVFDPKVLRGYDAIVLNSTAHLNIPEEKQRQALLDYVQRGGGVIGIHAAIDMFKRWPEGAKIVGATFAGHPWGPNAEWAVKLEEPGHPLLRAFGGKDFKLQDEFYELGEPYARSDRRVLMKLDVADAATAGVTPLHRQDRDFAVSWVKRFGKGRVFYGMFGHRAEPFMNPTVLRFYLDGIQYALGDLPVADSPRR